MSYANPITPVSAKYGAPLYSAQDQDGNTVLIRASSRNAAKANLRASFGALTFYR